MLNREYLDNIYYFWDKLGSYNGLKFWNLSYKGGLSKTQLQFLKLIDKLNEVIMAQYGQYNGQTKAEFKKNFTRIKDIMTKAPGDEDKQIRLAQTQANLIKDEWKAINRSMAAKELGHIHLFEVFFQKAYELGSVGKQEYREYQLERLGI